MPDILSPSFIAIADFVLKSFLILLAAFAADFIFRKANADLRHTLWMAALVVVLILPFISNSLPKINLPVLSFLGLNLAPAAVDASLPAAAAKSDLGGGGEALSPGLMLTLGFYLAGLVIVAIWQFVGRMYATSLRKRSSEIDNQVLRRIRAGLADELNLKELPRIMTSPMIKIPVTTGVFSPVIVLPEESVRWPETLLRSVMAHEMAHIKRMDLLSRAIGQISCCINWFNPLAWFGLQNILVEQEFACDSHVINSGAKPSEYAENLLEVANIRGSKVDHALATMGRKEELKGRILEILTPTRKKDNKGKVQLVVLLSILGALFVPAMLLNPWVSSATEEISSVKKVDASEIEKKEAAKTAQKEKYQADLEMKAKEYFNSVTSLIKSGNKISLEKAKSIIKQMAYFEKNTKIIDSKTFEKFATGVKMAVGTPKEKPVSPFMFKKKSSEEEKSKASEKSMEFKTIKKKNPDGSVETKKETDAQREKRLKEEAIKKKLMEKEKNGKEQLQ